MKTKIGKCLAIFTALAGVAFLGFASVSVIGGPNWEARMQASDLNDYDFIPSEDVPPSWSVKRKLAGGAAVGAPTKVTPQALITARTDLQAKQNEELQELQDSAAALQDQLAEVKQFIADDEKGIQRRLNELQQEWESINTKIAEVSAAIQERSKQVVDTQDEATRRQEDVRLYEVQLEILKTDKYRAEEQQEVLRDQLVRIRGVNDALERRNEELKTATGSR